MAMRQFSRLSVRYRVILIALAVIILPAELIVHSIFARDYYYLNVKNLRLVALSAAKMGAVYLPTNPRAAVDRGCIRAGSQSRRPRSSSLSPLRIATCSRSGWIVEFRYIWRCSRWDCRRVTSASRRRQGDNGQDYPFGTKILWFSGNPIEPAGSAN